MSALGDVVIDAIQELLSILFSPITKFIEDNGDGLVQTVVSTPHPNAVFSRPTNSAWPNIYDYYWDTIVPLSLLLWALAIGLVIFLETTSHLFSSYHRSKLKKRSFTGLLGILSWWWIAALSLRFMDALTGFIVPSLSNISLFQTLSFSALGVLGLVLTLAADLVLFVLIAMIYFIRQVVLYLFVLLMPVLIAFWIPGVGPFFLASRFMSRLAGFYVPFLFMTVPVAVLFRLGDLLGSSVSLSMGGFGAWLTALIIPLVAVVSPFVLFWQAGSLFSMTDRTAGHTSRARATQRAASVRANEQKAALGGRNFMRGTRGAPAVTRDGQTAPDSGGSRAHRAGSRLRSTGARFRQVVRSERGHPGATETRVNGGAITDDSPSTGDGRATNFDNLQDRSRTTGDGGKRHHPPDDEPIPYYQ